MAGRRGAPHQEQYAAVDWRIVPELVDELGRLPDVAAACLLLIVATVVRAGTARLARWADIDLEARVWTPPLTDLKDGRHHKRQFVIPLNDVAVRALESMRGRSPRYVFGSPLRENDLSNLVRRLRRLHPGWVDKDTREPFTIHGSSRATFRTWVEDTRRLDGPLAELSLGHKIPGGEVSARYIRTGLVPERRELLDKWSDHCIGKSADIIQLPRRA